MKKMSKYRGDNIFFDQFIFGMTTFCKLDSLLIDGVFLLLLGPCCQKGRDPDFQINFQKFSQVMNVLGTLFQSVWEKGFSCLKDLFKIFFDFRDILGKLGYCKY